MICFTNVPLNDCTNSSNLNLNPFNTESTVSRSAASNRCRVIIGRKTHSAVPSSVCVAVKTFFIAVDEDGRQRFDIASNMHPTSSAKNNGNKDEKHF